MQSFPANFALVTLPSPNLDSEIYWNPNGTIVAEGYASSAAAEQDAVTRFGDEWRKSVEVTDRTYMTPEFNAYCAKKSAEDADSLYDMLKLSLR